MACCLEIGPLFKSGNTLTINQRTTSLSAVSSLCVTPLAKPLGCQEALMTDNATASPPSLVPEKLLAVAGTQQA